MGDVSLRLASLPAIHDHGCLRDGDVSSCKDTIMKRKSKVTMEIGVDKTDFVGSKVAS